MPYPSNHPILYVMWMDMPDGGNAQKLIKARFQFLDRRVRNRISFGGLVVEKLALLAIGRQQSTTTTARCFGIWMDLVNSITYTVAIITVIAMVVHSPS